MGLADRLQPPATASAALWTRGALRPMPKGHVMGVPGTAAALAGVLSDEGLARIERDAELPPTEIGDDVAIGEYVAERFGREVVDRLVEPLLGGVYAGDAYRISMRSAVLGPLRRRPRARHPDRGGPRRAGEDRRRAADRTRLHGRRGRRGHPAARGRRLPARPGVRILTGTPVTELRREPDDGWRLVAGGEVLHADAVVVAVPAPAAADLLRAEAPGAAAELSAVEYASMALITLAYRRDEARLPEGSGFLVPPVEARSIKASTFASRKWGWIAEENPDLAVVRTSVGRHGETELLHRDDDELVELSRHDLKAATGLDAAPVATRVTRWDDGLPQYPVGHHARVARVRAHLAGLSGLAVRRRVRRGRRPRVHRERLRRRRPDPG